MRATLYVPWESTAICTARDYTFTVSAGKKLQTATQMLSFLGANPEILRHLRISDVDAFAREVTQFVAEYGNDFAISVAVDLNTNYGDIYVSLPHASDAACHALKSTQFFQSIEGWLGFLGVEVKHVYCGSDIHTKFGLTRSVVPNPLPASLCTEKVVFLYVLGTIDVKFD